MPIPTFSGLPPNAQYEDVVRKINTLVMELQNLMLTLDTLNVIELNAEVIVAGSITADKIGAGEITANEIAANTITAVKMNVEELSAIAANLGTINAGTVNGININGSTVTGGTLQTAISGSRVVITGNIITIYDSSDLVSIIIDSTTAPPKINFYESGVLKASIYHIGGNFTIAGSTGTTLSDSISLLISNPNLTSPKINSGTTLDTLAQSDSTAATVADLVTDFNSLLSKLRAMNILS